MKQPATLILGWLAVASSTACGSSSDESQPMGGGPQAGGGGAQTAGAGAAGTNSGGSGHATIDGASAAGGGGGAQTGSDDGGSTDAVAGMTCPSAMATDTTAAQRKACTFKPGALVADTLGLTTAARQKIPLKHIIVMMKENRSYDHYLSQLPTHGQPDAEALPANFTNPDKQGAAVAPFHQTTTCVHDDPSHQWAAMHNQVNGGKEVDGFVTSAADTTSTDGHYVMGWYGDTDLPFYYFLANTFALSDRYFASARTGTWPNRDYLLLATSDGVTATGSQHPADNTPTIMSALDAKGISWGAYAPGAPFGEALTWTAAHAGVHDMAAFKTALANGTLPSVAFVDGPNSEHPTEDVQVGEASTRDLYQALLASPLWSTSAMIWTYDEAGGFFDHVPPPNSCIPRPQDSAFFELGARVPTVVISPYARKHYVSHVVSEHTSITRLIEAVFDVPALTARDANNNALLDMFDFECPPSLKPPAAPAAGQGGCN